MMSGADGYLRFLRDKAEDWVLRRIGTLAAKPQPRALRVMEEAIELGQSEFISREQAHSLVDHVYDRPVGDPVQEGGGVAFTWLAWCASRRLDPVTVMNTELNRAYALPIEKVKESVVRKEEAGIL